MIFRKRVEKMGFEAARSSSISRAGRIYRAHLFTVGFAFALGSLFLTELPGIRNLLDHYLMNPWAAIGGSLALLFRPPLMDILPMYILFSFLTPAAFWAARRWGWRTVFSVSLSTWFIAQAHVRDMLLNTFKDLPFIELGPFDLLAWQLLWVGGLFVGQRFQENRALLPQSRSLRLLLLIMAIAFLFWRWCSIAFGPDLVTRTWLLDKWHLGPLRLINFFVAASVVATFLKYLNRWEVPLRPLFLIGRHMLPVFCSQICLSVLLIGCTDSGNLTAEPLTSVLVLCQLFGRASVRLVFGMAISQKRFGASEATGARDCKADSESGDATERNRIPLSTRERTALATFIELLLTHAACGRSVPVPDKIRRLANSHDTVTGWTSN